MVKESPFEKVTSESRAEGTETEGVSPTEHSRQKAQNRQSLKSGMGLVWAKNFKEVYVAAQK